jgi:signal transduction histidine kinase
MIAIEGDRQILVAAVSNLLQDALNFTRKGGTVSLTTTVLGGGSNRAAPSTFDAA